VVGWGHDRLQQRMDGEGKGLELGRRLHGQPAPTRGKMEFSLGFGGGSSGSHQKVKVWSKLRGACYGTSRKKKKFGSLRTNTLAWGEKGNQSVRGLPGSI